MKTLVAGAVTIAGYLWGTPLIIFFLGSGLIFTIALRFTQVRNLKEMVYLLFNNKSSEKGLSSFQAFALAIAGRVGTGNIAGVATAICYGGRVHYSGCGLLPFLVQASPLSKELYPSCIRKKLTENTGEGHPSISVKA